MVPENDLGELVMSWVICSKMKSMSSAIIAFVICFGMEVWQASAQDIHFPDYMPSGTGSEKVWFIHGWQPGKSKTHIWLYSKLLKESFGEEVFIYSWDAAGTWDEAKQKVSTEAKRLVEKISLCPPKQQVELIIVGHSLGARMLTEALHELREKSIKVRRVIFLGGAVNFDTPQLNEAEKISIDPPINVFNRDDGILRNLYSSRENTFACGNVGIGIDAKFRQYEVPVSDTATRTIGTEIANNINHSVKQYLMTLKHIFDSQADESIVPRIEEISRLLEEVGLPKMDARTPLPTPVKIIEQVKKWEFGVLTVFGKPLPVYTIFDPYGRLVYSDELQNTQDKWNAIKTKLTQQTKL